MEVGSGQGRPVLHTIGHSTLTFEELADLLRHNGVSLLADVRTIPGSRHNPQFNQLELARTLPAAGIEYRHLPLLGGLRKGHKDSPNTGWRSPAFRAYADYMAEPGFAEGLGELIRLAGCGLVAVMCAEKLWWRCHRSLIADALLVAGLEVWHIMGPGRVEAHRLTPFARVEAGRLIYPAPERGT
jgi:uncharacterized protein (DUF488 family)